MRHICKIEKLEIRVCIKYFCKKEMPPKEIDEDFMETFRKQPPSYSTVKNGQQSLRVGERESVDDDVQSGHPKEVTTDEKVKVVHTLVMCDRRRDLQSIHAPSEMGISFVAVQSVLTAILDMSKVSVRWVPGMFTDNQKMTCFDISRYYSCLAMKMILAILLSEL